jgi:signal transduction histidine kinase/phage shock protein PspC (stress-responsive transcriptional regulator)
VRVTTGRGLAGVARGVAAHLGLRVSVVRWAFVGGLAALGVSAVLYAFLWAVMPREAPSTKRTVPAVFRLRWNRQTGIALAGVVCVLAAGLLLAQSAGVNVRTEWWLPGGALVGGVALVWSQLERRSTGAGKPVHDHAHASFAPGSPAGAGAGLPSFFQAASRGRSPVSVMRLAGGLALVITGVVLLIWQSQPVGSLGYAILAGLAVVAGVATVLAPWWLRLLGELGDERAARAREAERADIAAHLHDSVLQTLAVLRARAEDPDTVRRLARAQERELRSWLYETRAPASDSVAAGLKEVVAEIEDTSGIEVGTVIVGDGAPWPASEALLRAVREALANAVRHGAPPIDVYLEVSERGVEAFVRDRGPGFDLAAVSADRLGVRESIIGRVQRVGGGAHVGRARGGGTEVRLSVPASAVGGDG